MAISDKLTYLNETKSQLKTMINYGLETPLTNEPFRDYVSSIFKAYIESLNNPETLWGNLPKITGTGESITLNNTIEAPMKLELNPVELEQGENPSPTNPQEIHTISGDNEIVVSNKNLFDGFWESGSIDNTTGVNTFDAQAIRSIDYIEVKPSTTYTISTENNCSIFPHYYDKNKNYISYNSTQNTPKTITTPSNCYYLKLRTRQSENITNLSLKCQLEYGSTATSYIEHKEQVKEINLPVENLLDISTLQTGYVASNGTVSTSGISNEEKYSSFIKVQPNTKYTFKIFETTWSGFANNNWIGIGEYTSNNTSNFIQRDTMTTGTQNYYTFTTTSTTQYVIVSARGLASATKIQLNKGDLNSYTPYGTEPIEYCEIGDYKDDFIRTDGRNLSNGINQNVYLNQAVNSCGIASDNSGLYIPVNGGNYTISTTKTQTRYRVACSSVIPPSVGNTTAYNGQNKDNTSNTITIDTTGYSYLLVNATDLSAIQIEQGSSASEFEPYGNGLWYIKKNIGKVVLDGTEDWSTRTGATTYAYQIVDLFGGNNCKGLCSHWRFIQGGAGGNQSNECIASAATTKYLSLFTNNSSLDTTEHLKTWLQSHNTLVYYSLSTPTYTLLNDTLQTQLEDIYNTLKSYKGQTNISQVNNDLPFNISSSALEDLIG